jgi:hypothetical protein
MESCEVDLEPRLLGSTCNPEELTVSQQEEVHTNYRKVSQLLFRSISSKEIYRGGQYYPFWNEFLVLVLYFAALSYCHFVSFSVADNPRQHHGN